MAQTRTGISGWTYAPWRGVFYPKRHPQKDELRYASRAFNSIEINGTFYSLQKPSSFETWYEQTPDDFVFSVKAGKFITHVKKLAGVEAALANFFAQGLLALREKLGPILWQLPPNLGYDADRVEAFLKLLPHDTDELSKLAAKHDERMKGRVVLKSDAERPVRHAMEVRHASFETPAFVEQLRRHDVALVNADTAGKWPHMDDVTSDFIYARLHGDEEIYTNGYTDAALDDWAEKFKAWRDGGEPKDAKRVSEKSAKKRASRDVFVYFDNDLKVRSPFDAARLSERLGIRANAEPVPITDLANADEPPRKKSPTPKRKQ